MNLAGFETYLPGGPLFGEIRIVIDPLSIWFMIIITVLFGFGAIYGSDYISHYKEHKTSVKVHWVAYAVCFLSMLSLCVIRHTLAFMIAWELMALSSFVLIVFENWKKDVLEAGLNFFIQSHISVVFLTIGFASLMIRTGSFDFSSIAYFSQNNNVTFELIMLLAGFGVKAGFFPFHTWLPKAHPAAPAHISGVMSGVIIKIGIYGIIRMLMTFKNFDLYSVGSWILGFGAVSGLYGVMQAALQRNIKTLLAYSSIENIGIIGMGIGISCIGLGSGNSAIAALGMAGALLHTLNHSLFKSTLFFCAGNVYHSTHTLDMERLGGLSKKMPRTAFLFICASVAICGLPPMNGFISELLVYLGMYNWLEIASPLSAVASTFSIIALVLIGGIAIMCFTKASGIVFLGLPREELHEVKEQGWKRTLPMYAMLLCMLSIGLVPQVYVNALSSVVESFGMRPLYAFIPKTMTSISIICASFVILVALIVLLRKLTVKGRVVSDVPVWGCGYTAGTSRIQYTGNSYVRTFIDLFRGVLGFRHESVRISKTYPETVKFSSESYDKVETEYISAPLESLRRLLLRFSFLQNGRIQSYILYGIICIVLAILLTFILV